MRVLCPDCDEVLAGADREALVAALVAHLRDAHGEADPDHPELVRWVMAGAYEPGALTETVFFAGRILAVSAAGIFLILAASNPGKLSGSARTHEVFAWIGFSLIAVVLLCLLVIGREIVRGHRD
jgi:hypothetical protein